MELFSNVFIKLLKINQIKMLFRKSKGGLEWLKLSEVFISQIEEILIILHTRCDLLSFQKLARNNSKFCCKFSQLILYFLPL